MTCELCCLNLSISDQNKYFLPATTLRSNEIVKKDKSWVEVDTMVIRMVIQNLKLTWKRLINLINRHACIRRFERVVSGLKMIILGFKTSKIVKKQNSLLLAHIMHIAHFHSLYGADMRLISCRWVTYLPIVWWMLRRRLTCIRWVNIKPTIGQCQQACVSFSVTYRYLGTKGSYV